MSDPLANPVLSSRSFRKEERKLKYADLAIQGTNNSSIASKRSVELLYAPAMGMNRSSTSVNNVKEYFKWFVPKKVSRSPCINRGYWLRLHAIRSCLDSIVQTLQDNEKMVVVNLGCGFDPLAFELLDPENMSAAKYRNKISFIDVDYPDLLRNKIQILKDTPELSTIIGSDVEINEAINANGDGIETRNYSAIPCDLNDANTFANLLNSTDILKKDKKIVKVFIAEVSLAYMKYQQADKIISLTGALPNSQFIILEQLTPEGPFEPFSKQMLAHFKKNDSPLQSVQKYPTVNSQLSRFKSLGYMNANAGDLLQLWNSVPLITRQQIEMIQPFDELEEFHLFAHHYLLLHATNNPAYKFVDSFENPQSVKDLAPIHVDFEETTLDLKRNFGASALVSASDSSKEIWYHGGCNPYRTNETLQIKLA